MTARSLAAAGVVSSALLGAAIATMTLLPGVAEAAAYTTVDFTGRITDDKGQPIPNATVKIQSDQGVVRTATADSSGYIHLPAIQSGRYQATVNAPGYSTLTNQVIQVTPSTSTFAFTMGQEGMQEVVVTGARPVRDFNKTDGGLSVNVQEIADRSPIARSINAAVMLTPTVSLADPSIVANGVRRNQQAVSVSGTSAAESVYYINGLNVTDQRTFLGYSDLPFEMIQSVDVKTGGYQAEYGRGTGGIVNIVTRSGSNDFHFGASAYFSPDSLRSDRPISYRPGGNNSVGIVDLQKTVEIDQSEQTVWASGPILEDHIFFFALYNARKSDNWGAVAFTNPLVANGTILNTQYDDPRWAAKLDFVFTDNHRLEATVFSDKETTAYRSWNYSRAEDRIAEAPGISNPDGSLLPYDQESGGTNYIFQYTGVLSEHLTISALAGRTGSNYGDKGAYIAQPGILDFGGYATLGRQAGPFNLVGEDTRDTYRLDFDGYFSLGGEHHMRLGFDYEDLTSTAVSAYSGGALYYGYEQIDCPAGADANGCIEKLTFANIGDFKATQSAWYIQDAWSVSPSLTLQLGLRGDMYDYQNVAGQSYIKITDQIAPRFGFSWDPSGTGHNRFYSSVGDYYLPIATNTSIRASSGEIYTDEYFMTQRDGNGDLVIDANGFPIIGAQLGTTDYFSPPGAPDPRSVIERGLNPMYEREISFGFEHQFEGAFLDSWTAGIRFTHRKLKSTIEDTAIGDAVIRYCDRQALACAGNDPGLYPYVLINPGDAANVFIDLDGDARADGAGNPNPDYNPQWIDLTEADLALDRVSREYKSVELSFQRPSDGKWSLQGSYTWAKSEGNYEGAVKSDVGQTDTSITQDFDHSANGINSFGYLPNDRRHTFKLIGNWAPFTERFNIGANVLVQTGRPYGCIGYVPTNVDPLAPTSGTASGWFCPRGQANPFVNPTTGEIITATGSIRDQLAAVGAPPTLYLNVDSPRGESGRTETVYNLDLNLSYKFFESETKGSATARLDVFNVLDGDAVTRVVEQGEVRATRKNVPAPFYGMPRSYQPARYVRVGVSYAF